MSIGWHLHKWGRWSRFTEDWSHVNRSTGKETKFIKTGQSRTCEVCGKEQRRYFDA